MKKEIFISLLVIIFLFGLLVLYHPIKFTGLFIYQEHLFVDTCLNNTYDDSSILNLGTILYLKFNNQTKYGENDEIVCDFSSHSNTGFVYNAQWNVSGGLFEDGAFEFDGDDEIIILDDDSLSPNTTKEFSVSFWIKPSTFTFTGTSYDLGCKCAIHPLSKYDTSNGGQREWYFRLYNETAVDGVSRSKRLSFYIFNLEGGAGVGSYFQDNLKDNEWIHVVGIVNGSHTFIYKNAVLRDSDFIFNSSIQMENGKADLRIGKLPNGGGYIGSIDELRIYNRVLNASEIEFIYNYTYKNLSLQKSENIQIQEEIQNTGGGSIVDWNFSNNAKECVESWMCTQWSDVSKSCGARTCTDKNKCGTIILKPIEKSDCVIETPEGGELKIKDTGAEGVTGEVIRVLDIDGRTAYSLFIISILIVLIIMVAIRKKKKIKKDK